MEDWRIDGENTCVTFISVFACEGGIGGEV